ncbi:MAG: hypothetical protein JKY82_03055 [Rhizobiaceae bacterium]|nr:hypothetical protein [Rhizobiaceae bacterium]
MKSDRETERQVQIRAEMTALLFEINPNNPSYAGKPNFPEDAQTYGMLMMLISSAVVILFLGDADYRMVAVSGAFGLVLGGLVVVASSYELATKLNRASLVVFSYTVKLVRAVKQIRKH